MNKDITILYVDDEPINLQIFEINFRKKYKVITALSGDEGLSKLDEHNDILIVVSDMKMPGMNGIEFIRKARSNFDHIAYFILTGFDITPEISEALKDNTIHKYFRKPFNMLEINEAIEQAIKDAL